jgi:hypothetical protein
MEEVKLNPSILFTDFVNADESIITMGGPMLLRKILKLC